MAGRYSSTKPWSSKFLRLVAMNSTLPVLVCRPLRPTWLFRRGPQSGVSFSRSSANQRRAGVFLRSGLSGTMK